LGIESLRKQGEQGRKSILQNSRKRKAEAQGGIEAPEGEPSKKGETQAQEKKAIGEKLQRSCTIS